MSPDESGTSLARSSRPVSGRASEVPEPGSTLRSDGAKALRAAVGRSRRSGAALSFDAPELRTETSRSRMLDVSTGRFRTLPAGTGVLDRIRRSLDRS